MSATAATPRSDTPTTHAPSTAAGQPVDALTGHEYDGIQEFDNPTPGWWGIIFAITVIWSCAYLIVWELDPLAPSLDGQWQQDATAFNKKQFAKLGELKPDEPTLLEMMNNPEWMTVGESIFRGNCVTCHGRNGEGNVGPNMTDNSYKNIKQLTDILRVLREGAAGGAMPAQRSLSQNEMILVAAHVANLRGRNLPGKTAEGEVIPPWPKYVAPPPPAGDAGGKKK